MNILAKHGKVFTKFGRSLKKNDPNVGLLNLLSTVGVSHRSLLCGALRGVSNSHLTLIVLLASVDNSFSVHEVLPS